MAEPYELVPEVVEKQAAFTAAQKNRAQAEADGELDPIREERQAEAVARAELEAALRNAVVELGYGVIDHDGNVVAR